MQANLTVRRVYNALVSQNILCQNLHNVASNLLCSQNEQGLWQIPASNPQSLSQTRTECFWTCILFCLSDFHHLTRLTISPFGLLSPLLPISSHIFNLLYRWIPIWITSEVPAASAVSTFTHRLIDEHIHSFQEVVLKVSVWPILGNSQNPNKYSLTLFDMWPTHTGEDNLLHCSPA